MRRLHYQRHAALAFMLAARAGGCSPADDDGAAAGGTDAGDAEPGPEVSADVPEATPRCPAEERFWEDVDLTAFEPVGAFADLDFSQIVPAMDVTYWELRQYDGTVLRSEGELCAEAADADTCVEAFNAVWPEMGFPRCQGMESCGWYYFAINDGEESWAAGSSEAVGPFLGTIESTVEAVILAVSDGYGLAGGGYIGQPPSLPRLAQLRADEAGFTMVLFRLVESCAPILTYRYVVSVARDGTLTREREQVFYMCCTACL